MIREAFKFFIWACLWSLMAVLMIDSALDIAQRVTDFLAVAR